MQLFNFYSLETLRRYGFNKNTLFGTGVFFVSLFLISCQSLNENAGDENDRVFNDIEVLKQKKINFRPKYMTSQRGNLIVLDGYTQELKFYDEDLVLRRVFGKNGPSPEEFGNANSVEILPDSSIVVADAGQNAIKVLSLVDGGLLDYYKLPFKFDRSLVSPGGGGFIFVRTVSGFRLGFSSLNKVNGKWILKDSLRVSTAFERDGSSILDDGFFAKNTNGEEFFVSYLNLNRYKFNATREDIVRAPANFEILQPTVTLMDKFAAPDVSEIYVSSITADNDFLYIVSRLADSEGNRVLDCYDVENLEYTKSYSLPFFDEEKSEYVTLIATDNEFLYASTENNLVKFRLD